MSQSLGSLPLLAVHRRRPRIVSSLAAISLTFLACSASSERTPGPEHDAAPPPSPADASTGSASDAAVLPTDAGQEVDAEAPRPPVDCTNLPSGPFETRRVPYIKPSADIAFDDEGALYWSEGGSLFKARAGEPPALLAEHVDLYAGLRASPSGYLFAETATGLSRISPEGTVYAMLSGVRGLSALELDARGRAYLADYFGGRILRFDPATHELTTLSTGVIPSPSGLTYNPHFDTLYVSTWGGAEVPTLYRIGIDGDGKAGPTEPWVQNLGGGINDGMASDECGNVYVADNGGQGDLLRISADGTRRDIVVSRPGESLVNFQWGRGRGWSRDKLYIVSLGQGLFEADMPVRSKTYW